MQFNEIPSEAIFLPASVNICKVGRDGGGVGCVCVCVGIVKKISCTLKLMDGEGERLLC